jgi:hypothetical protein
VFIHVLCRNLAAVVHEASGRVHQGGDKTGAEPDCVACELVLK